MGTHLLLVKCADQPGLVHRITGVIYRHGFNVLENHEFVDDTNQLFFMRTAIDGKLDREKLLKETRQELPEGAEVRVAQTGERPIVIMVTREHHCLSELLIRSLFGNLNARIQAVIGNHPDLQGFVEKFDVPFHHISHQGKTREQHEEEISKVIDRCDPAFVVLAKYMRILNPSFVNRYPQKLINIHHSFLPAFIGARPYKQAYQRGVKIIGATAHFVTEELDNGPIISQDVIPVDHTHNPEDMAQAGRDIEKLVLARALNLALEERVFLLGNRTVIFD